MKFVLILFSLVFSNSLFAQDSTTCICSRMVKPPNYPKKAEENRISGQVIIEVDVNENCIFSNPIIKKGIGYGCDEEALRITKREIDFYNDCTRKCKSRKQCNKGKTIQTITFQLSDD